MNKVILVGRLARDPEVRYTQSGKANATFTLAVTRYGKNNEADFINCVAWEKLAEIVGNNLLKGSQILVEGRIQVRNYETQDGQKRYVTEVIAQNIEFMGSKQSKPSDGQADNSGANSFGSEIIPDDTDIPF
ncbi:MAG: ssbA [Massilibacillus sp.]|jgi:single-strand DNA-binding protein|nr:ssbA [Massilibacillus sp.]